MLGLYQVSDIVEHAKLCLESARREVHLKVTDHALDDGWPYITVTPAEAGIRASDHADLMERIERELRALPYDHVLLVPTVPGYD